tara:strand:- start:3340 stop:3660 length:321 start_codon:yes stop_codon:yes gene_type:complete
LRLRLEKAGTLKPSSPLFVTQKAGAYSPSTLQEHMAVILRDWAGLEKASSHSGRRSLITNVIHKQKKSVKVAQKFAGHGERPKVSHTGQRVYSQYYKENLPLPDRK